MLVSKDCQTDTIAPPEWCHQNLAKNVHSQIEQKNLDWGADFSLVLATFIFELTRIIYVVVFEAPNLELSIPLVLFDLATALPVITLQISVTIPMNRLKRCCFAVTLPSVACPNA